MVIWNGNVRRDKLDEKWIILMDNITISYSKIVVVELIGINYL